MLDKIPQKNTELAWRVIDNETVIIPLDEQTSDSEKINFLNETGTRIWELIDGKNSIKDIVVMIVKEYEIDEEEGKKEVINFIKKLERKNLVKLGGER
ncbi:MAG: PqqD family protein [Candidatus Omnitrophica bacterium]|nr:PqqD family protein [Candidatus Omnitrophota bacterium]